METYTYLIETLPPENQTWYKGEVKAASFSMAALKATNDARNKATNKAAFDRLTGLFIRVGKKGASI